MSGPDRLSRLADTFVAPPAVVPSGSNGTLAAAGHAADQALSIATHCEYRLTQADAHLTLADIASQAGDSPMAIAHARLSRDLAWCQGPSHSYASVLARANALLKLLVAPAG